MQKLFLTLLACLLLGGAVVAGPGTPTNGPLVREATPPCFLPAPTNVQRTFLQPDMVQYTWNPVVGAAKYYAVLTNLTLGGMQVSQQPIGTSITFTGLIPNHQYMFTLAAMCTGKDVSDNEVNDFFKAPGIVIDLIVEAQQGCNMFNAPVGDYNWSNGVYTCTYEWEAGHQYWMKMNDNEGAILYFNRTPNDPEGNFVVTVIDPPGGDDYSFEPCSGCLVGTIKKNSFVIFKLFYPANNAISVTSQTGFFSFTIHDGCGYGFGSEGGEDRSGSSGGANVEIPSTYPNPFSGHLTLYFNSFPADASVQARLYDAQGVLQIDTRIQAGDLDGGAYSLPTEHLPPGMYFLQTESAGGQINTQKLLKF
jgi:hypothetical protein